MIEDDNQSGLVEDKLQKADGVFLKQRSANKTNQSTVNRIYDYYHSDSRLELDEDETAIMHRWEKAWLLLCRHRTPKTVAELLVKLFGIKRSTAFDDVRNAMDMFSDPRKDLTAAKRAIAEDGILKGADKAWKTGDLKMHAEYMKQYIEINGLKNASSQDSALADLIKNLKPQQIVITSTKEEATKQAEQLRDSLMQYIPFEIVE